MKINPHAALTYDATFVLANGMDILMKNKVPINGDNFKRAVFNDSVSFIGATGIVASYEGMAGLGYYAQGW